MPLQGKNEGEPHPQKGFSKFPTITPANFYGCSPPLPPTPPPPRRISISHSRVFAIHSLGDSVYLLSTKDLMFNRLQSLATQHYELQPREDHAIRFSANNETLHEMIDSFGSIDASYAHYATTSAEGRGLQEATLNQAVSFTVVTRSVRKHPILVPSTACVLGG